MGQLDKPPRVFLHGTPRQWGMGVSLHSILPDFSVSRLDVPLQTSLQLDLVLSEQSDVALAWIQERWVILFAELQQCSGVRSAPQQWAS